MDDTRKLKKILYFLALVLLLLFAWDAFVMNYRKEFMSDNVIIWIIFDLKFILYIIHCHMKNIDGKANKRILKAIDILAIFSIILIIVCIVTGFIVPTFKLSLKDYYFYYISVMIFNVMFEVYYSKTRKNINSNIVNNNEVNSSGNTYFNQPKDNEQTEKGTFFRIEKQGEDKSDNKIV